MRLLLGLREERYAWSPGIRYSLATVLVKIFKSEEYFEAKGAVIYANPTLGMGLAFRDVKPDFRMVMQKWLLAAAQDTFGPKS